MTARPQSCLVLGGTRSGKSVHAERLAERWSARPLYIATAAAGDAEMRDRIARHRDRRGPAWRTREEPLALPAALAMLSEGEVALVDCLTVWLGNLMVAGQDVEQAARELCDAVERCPARLILVANEVGLSRLPDNRMASDFAGHAGRLNRALAARVGEVTFLLAGCPVTLKPETSRNRFG